MYTKINYDLVFIIKVKANKGSTEESMPSPPGARAGTV